MFVKSKKINKERKKRGVFKIKPGITGLAQVTSINMKTPTLLAKTDQRMIRNLTYITIFIIF